MTPKTLIFRSAGTNCEQELAHAFRLAGAQVDFVHLNTLIQTPEVLREYDLIGVPGGFSYGDDIAAGRIYANRIRHRLYPALREAVLAGKPMIGICNGFQILAKAGLLPGFELPEHQAPAQLATLADNSTMRFTDKWVGMAADASSRCIWTRGLGDFDLPIAHGEGRFVAADDVLDRLEAAGQVALRYTHNPNGSMRDIAGICDPTGLVLGLMPHPERFTDPTHHPAWTRQRPVAAGLRFFTNAVEHVRSHAAATQASSIASP